MKCEYDMKIARGGRAPLLFLGAAYKWTIFIIKVHNVSIFIIIKFPFLNSIQYF